MNIKATGTNSREVFIPVNEAQFMANDEGEITPLQAGFVSLLAGTALVTAWATGTDYVIGDIRRNNSCLYRCLIAHTSNDFMTELAAGRWIALDNKSLEMPVELLAKRNAANPTYQIDITFTQFNVQGIYATAGTYTFDVTAAIGPGGLDAGAEAPSTWYYVYVICKEDGTTNVIGSTSSAGPALPAGYTRYRFSTPVYNSAGGDFVDFHQQQQFYFYTITQTAAAVAASMGAPAAVDCRAIIPSIVYEIYIVLYAIAHDVGSTSNIFSYLYGTLNGGYRFQGEEINGDAIVGGTVTANHRFLGITYNRYFQWRVYSVIGGTTAFAAYFYIHGFKIPFGEI